MQEVFSRSTLRAMDKRHSSRPRGYALRWFAVAAFGGGVLILVRAIADRAFAQDGIGWLLYMIHDTVFLPIKGAVWTQWFPYVTVWLLPLAVIAVLAALEFLTKAGPVRFVHKAVILRLGTQPWFQRFLAPSLAGRMIDAGVWSASLEPGTAPALRRFGFARRVVQKEQDALWMKIATDLAEGAAPEGQDFDRLIRLTHMRLRLDPSDAKAHLSALEVLASGPASQAKATFSKEFARFLDGQTAEAAVAPVFKTLSDISTYDTENEEDLHARLHQQTADFSNTIAYAPQGRSEIALKIACEALLIFAIAAKHPHPDHRGFQLLWATARLTKTPSGVAQAMAQAETLIFFEMWSKRIEAAPTRAGSDTLLAQALAAGGAKELQFIEGAEAFAWNGTPI